jgi:hypothetical protein
MNDYHESEVITLEAKREWLRTDLHAFLMEIGFKSVDDCYKFKRSGNLPAWQSTTLLSIDVRLRGAEVYETEEDVNEGKSGKWDSLVAKYLMATVPKECVRPAVDLLFSVCYGLIWRHRIVVSDRYLIRKLK